MYSNRGAKLRIVDKPKFHFRQELSNNAPKKLVVHACRFFSVCMKISHHKDFKHSPPKRRLSKQRLSKGRATKDIFERPSKAM